MADSTICRGSIDPLQIALATLRVPAGVADDAAFLAGQPAAAVGAGTDDRELAGVWKAVLDQVVLGHGPRHAIGDGEDCVRSYAGGVAILDTAELVDHLGRVGAVGKGHRDHTPQGVRERGGRAAGLAEDDETLPRPELVVVHRDVHRAVSGTDLLGHARQGARPPVARLGERGEGLWLGRSTLRGCNRGCRRRLGRGGRHGRSLPARLARRQDLSVARAIAVDRYPLTVQGVGLTVGVLDVLGRRVVWQVDGLGDTHRGVLLEGGLHPDVPLASNVVRGDPHAAHVVGDPFDVAHGAVLGDRSHQLLRVEGALLGELDELGVDVWHLHVGLPAHEGHGEERLYAARAAGDHRDRTRRGYGGDGRVADPVATRLVARTHVVGHNAALLGEGPALLPSLVVNELHYPLGEGEALFRVVCDAQLYEEVGEAHDPEPDTSVPTAHLVDLGQGVVVLLDDVVQKADRGVYRIPQLIPVDLFRILAVEALQVDRTQVARVVRRQVRLGARIRRLYRELRRRVVVVDLVYEHDARFAVEMRPLDDLPEQVPGANGLHDLPVAGVLELEV